MTPDVSVVVPTYNRLSRLKRTLDGLATQTELEHDLEVVVVSDGSSDGTDEWLRSGEVPLPVVARFQANAGPATARNHGVDAARGRLVLFIDDDVVPMPDLVAAHLRRHQGCDDELVVIGPMNTPDDHALSPWVEWEQRMLYKQYAAIARGDWGATPRQFYTGNASVARRHLVSVGGFNPAFRRAEDVELAYRLADAGLEFEFAPEASVLHYADRSYDSWLANAAAYGHNDAIFARDEGRGWLLDAVSQEFNERHRVIRVVTVASLRHPRLGAGLSGAANRTAKVVSQRGPERVGSALLSVVYNLEYYRGMADELGVDDSLLERFESAAVGV